MTYDPKRRDSTWTMIQPGCWIDPAGHADLFPDEIIAFLQTMHPEAGFEYTKADYDMVVAMFRKSIQEAAGKNDVQFIQHTREDVA